MRVLYLTYCSRRKQTAAGMLPAIRRYRSRRIRMVAALAGRERAAFRILSGKYGLITAGRRIPYYDHLLRPEEVAAMTIRVTPQLHGWQRVVFWYDPTDYLTPYRAVMRRAAAAAGVPLRFSRLPVAIP